LYNPSILILDEATSSIDTESEQLIQRAIDTLIAGRTSIVIAHRLSTIQKASKILVLDKGEVKETGTHAELLANQSYYYQLHKMQFEDKGNLV
jgi:ATP-binding cassette subfamily B protein